MIIAIDPGPVESAFVLYESDAQAFAPLHWRGASFGKLPNAVLLELVRTRGRHGDPGDLFAIEMIASYGMPVGAEVFETCVWIGRFVEAWSRPHAYVYRREVKLHLCGQARAKDGNIRQALIDRFGPGKEKAIGKKNSPGPLFGVTADVWAALGVAVTFADRPELGAGAERTGAAA